jgi:nucleotide-binding universal stress UspA family protein
VRHFPTKILLATDGSEDAGLALRAAVDLCSRMDSELHVVHAWRPFPEHSHPSVAMASDSALYEREAQEVLFGQLDKVEEAGAVAAGAHLKRGRAAETIADAARDLGAALIVVGSRGLGPGGRLVMGSVSEGVVDLAACPVLVVRGGEGAWPPARIVVGEDGSVGARETGRIAAGVGRALGAELLLVRAQPVGLHLAEASRLSRDPVGVPESIRRAHHQASLAGRANQLREVLGRTPRFRLIEGEPASVLLGVAEERGGSTLVCVGRRGLGLLERLRLGSVSTKVLRASAGPALIGPPGSP